MSSRAAARWAESRDLWSTPRARPGIGISISTTGYENAADILRDADTAMYRAKTQGKACYEIFDPTMRDQMVARMQLETDLRRAVENQEFRAFYQVIVSLTDWKIFGFEALIRWQHPTRGLVSPAEFVPLAEETGMILWLGRWVLQEACRQMALWKVQFQPSFTWWRRSPQFGQVCSPGFSRPDHRHLKAVLRTQFWCV